MPDARIGEDFSKAQRYGEKQNKALQGKRSNDQTGHHQGSDFTRCFTCKELALDLHEEAYARSIGQLGRHMELIRCLPVVMSEQWASQQVC